MSRSGSSSPLRYEDFDLISEEFVTTSPTRTRYVAPRSRSPSPVRTPYTVMDLPGELIGKTMSFTGIDRPMKSRIEYRYGGNFDSYLNPEELVAEYERVANEYRRALLSGDMTRANEAELRAESILVQLCRTGDYRWTSRAMSRVPRGTKSLPLEKSRLMKRVYRATGLGSLYQLYPLVFGSCGLNEDAVNYPAGAYVAALVDEKDGVPGATAAVNSFETNYPGVCNNGALGGAAGRVKAMQ